MPRFRDLPQFTRWSSYHVNLPWDYLPGSLIRYVDHYGLNMNPDFQRAHVWTPTQKVRYIEYVLQGGHSGRAIWTNAPGWQAASDIGEFVLVDGKQRIEAAMGFLNNEFAIFEGQEYGGFYRDFTDKLDMMHANFEFHVNTLKTRDEVLQWYIDLNRGGTQHSEEEIDRVRALKNGSDWEPCSKEQRLVDARFDRQIVVDAYAKEAEREEAMRKHRAEQDALEAAKPKRGRKKAR